LLVRSRAAVEELPLGRRNDRGNKGGVNVSATGVVHPAPSSVHVVDLVPVRRAAAAVQPRQRDDPPVSQRGRGPVPPAVGHLLRLEELVVAGSKNVPRFSPVKT
jgi:hypothetical protein